MYVSYIVCYNVINDKWHGNIHTKGKVQAAILSKVVWVGSAKREISGQRFEGDGKVNIFWGTVTQALGESMQMPKTQNLGNSGGTK